MIFRQIPNILTITRLIMITPFLAFLYQSEYTNAFYVFMLAGFTDGLDGWLARQFKWQSAFGSFMDPVADKLLIATSFISLAFLGELPWWLVALVFSRDLMISIGVLVWHFALRRPLNFKPTLLSKINTVFQLSLVTLCLFDLAFPGYSLMPGLEQLLLMLTTITTGSSFIDYGWTWGRKAFSVPSCPTA